METLLGKHEADASNFDCRIESNLRTAVPSNFEIQTNHRVAKVTQYNSDIVIDIPSVSICIEIEKGYLSRFELDIFKMQVHASSLLEKDNRTKVYGAFIVPADNVVASHITGNSRESSFKYLTRLSRLVANISPMLLQDILIVGYSTTPLEMKVKTAKGQKPRQAKESRNPSLVVGETGLVDVDQIRQELKSYPLELVLRLRDRLISTFPNLREKLNTRSRYLGYANGLQSDGVGSPWHEKNWIGSKKYADVPLMAETWKRSPIVFEWFGDYAYLQSQKWSFDAAVSFMLNNHVVLINDNVGKVPPEAMGQLEKLARLAGARLVLRELSHEKSAKPGDRVTLKMKWANVGVCKLYRPYVLRFVLLDSGGKVAFTADGAADLRQWLPGEFEVSESFTVPADLKAGEYSLAMSVVDPTGGRRPFQLAIDAPQTDGRCMISRIRIE